MTAPKYSISPVSSFDLPTLANFIHSSKLALSINRVIFQPWPNEPLQRTLYTNAVESAYEDPSMECFKAVEDESNEIIGYIVIAQKQPVNSKEKPSTDTNNQNASSRQDIPDGLNPGLLTEVTNGAAEIAKDTEEIDRFGKTYLSIHIRTELTFQVELIYMCVRPSKQRHGVGFQLMQLGFDRAKAEGIPFAICAEAPAYGFFAKLGFKDLRHQDIDLRKYTSAYSGFGVFRLSGMIWRP